MMLVSNSLVHGSKTKSMNWGKGIAIAMTAFIIFIVVLVVGFFSHSVDLESDDYYQQEIAYDDEIVALNNANNLEHKPTISITETHLVIEFHNELEFTNAQVYLQRPDSEEMDQIIPIENTKIMTIPLTSLIKGVYNVELFFITGGKNCLHKEQIYI